MSRLTRIYGGCKDKALSFNGTDEYVDISATSLTPYTLGSVSLWFKSTSTSVGQLIAFYSGNNNKYFSININYHSVGVLNANVRGNGILTSGKNYIDGNWHHIVVTHDGSVTRMYADGVFIGSNSGNAGGLNSRSGYSIGYNLANGNFHFNGVIDNVSVYSVVLTASEVDEEYNNGIALDSTTHSQSSNLSAYWKLTDSDTFGSNGILDSSGNANHGTAINMDTSNIVCGVPTT